MEAVDTLLLVALGSVSGHLLIYENAPKRFPTAHHRPVKHAGSHQTWMGIC